MSRQEGGDFIAKNQTNRELKCEKIGSTKFSNYPRKDIDYLFINIETEIRNYYVMEQNLTALDKKENKKGIIHAWLMRICVV